MINTSGVKIDAFAFFLGHSSVLELHIPYSEEGASFSANIASFASWSGSFASVSANLQSPDPCLVAASVVRFSPNELSVLVSVGKVCGLSKEAVAGIVIGAVMAVALLGSGLVVVVIFLKKRYVNHAGWHTKPASEDVENCASSELTPMFP
jgi:hypothetical protein